MSTRQWRHLNQQIQQLAQRIPQRRQRLTSQFRQCHLALHRSLSSPPALLLAGLTGFVAGLKLQNPSPEAKPDNQAIPAAGADARVASGFSLLPSLVWLWGWRHVFGWRWY
ncbi:hypothetical protein [Alishewanella longhuensis]